VPSQHFLPRRPNPATALIAAVTIVGLTLAGCASTGHTTAPTRIPAASLASTYPVIISNCGTDVTYDKAPTRAVSNDIQTTEDMIALGLEPHMVGYFGASGDGPEADPIPAEYAAGFHAMREVSSNYFTLEQLVALHPDFLFAGWNYGLQTGTALTPANLAKYGIQTLALTESCVHVHAGTTTGSIDDTYQDLTDLGRIFGVPQKAQQVIARLQTQIAAAHAKIAGLPPVTVFDYDSGEPAPFTGPGQAMVNALITLGGGTNIFAGLHQSWTSVSWEQVVKADPQCIIINDYGTPTAAQKQQFLESSPITKNLTAVKNRCFLTLAYDEVTPGPRNAEAVTAIAHWLHPDAFGLPPGGS
jgi:iron complex transport system substrate-binding protein